MSQNAKMFSSMASNQLISDGLEPVQSHTEKNHLEHYKQFSTNITIKITKLICTSFVSLIFRPLRNKTFFISIGAENCQ